MKSLFSPWPLLGAVFLLLVSPASHAYLDPGSGSLLLQVILGGVAGLLVAGKLFWHRILEILRIRKPLAEDTDGDEGE